MRIKRFLSLLFATALILTTLSGLIIINTSAGEDDYVREGLFAWYKGDENTRGGLDTQATAWHDLIGQHDLSVTIDDTNYFTEEGFHVQHQKHYFPEEILNLVNDSYYTIEIEFGEFDPTGTAYNVFMNSQNDHFSLFRRVSEDVIEWKFGGGNTRPKISKSMQYLRGHLLTFTCEYGGHIIMYVDGVEMARAECDLYMGADNLFIGQTEASRSYEALYKNIRFYSRPLTADEVDQNARAMGYDPDNLTVKQDYIAVAQPVTRIVGDVAVIRTVDSKTEFDQMMAGDVLPATAIYRINEDLEVLDETGTPFSTVADVMEDSLLQIIPCFVIEDRATALALADYLDRIYFYDVQLMSQDAEVLQYARTILPSCYGILDLRAKYATVTDLSQEQLLDIRRAVKTYNASVAVLPVSLCRNQDVQYLYDRQVNVWAWGTETPDEIEAYYALLSGAVGVVTDDTEGYLDIACNRLSRNTLTRVPSNVGHRGMPSKAPENTLEGSILAFEQGANVIEMDVYLTKDGHIVAMHDTTTERTCDTSVIVEQSTLATLQKIKANKGFESHRDYADCPIPTLEDYFAWFKGKDCLFFIEIKSGNPAIVTVLKELVEKYDIYDQCAVITFNKNIMATMREEYPEMSVGALSGLSMGSPSSDQDIPTIMGFIGPYNGTHNPSYSGYDADDLRACTIRGISIYPWTIAGSTDQLSDYFIWGYAGLTNDHAYMLKDVTRRIFLNEPPTIRLYRGMNLTHTVTNFDGDTYEKPVSRVILLDGEAVVSQDSLIPTGIGNLTFMTSSTFNLMDETTFVMYTQPVTLSIPDPNAKPEVETETPAEQTPDTEPVEPAETQEDTETATLTDEKPNQTDAESQTQDPQISDVPTEKGCGSTVSGAVCILTVLAAAIVCMTATRRRRS